jgi:hypothetical protein
MRALKLMIDEGMKEMEKRTPKTPAQMQNHDMHEYIAKKVLKIIISINMYMTAIFSQDGKPGPKKKSNLSLTKKVK